jgi:hypothetical protein
MDSWRDFIGGKEINRNSIMEALLTNYTPSGGMNKTMPRSTQLSFDDIGATV